MTSDDIESLIEIDDPESLPPQPPLIPAELAGRWIVWSQDGSRIIADADSPAEAWNIAGDNGGAIQYVPTFRRQVSRISADIV